MSKLWCAALLTLAIGCKEKAADAPKPSEPSPSQPASDPSPASRKAEAPKLPDQAQAGSGSGSGSAVPVAAESKEPGKVERHKVGGVPRGAFPINQASEQIKKQRARQQ